MVASSITPNWGRTSPTSTTKTTKTTVREFDADEHCIKETVTEVTETSTSYNDPYTTWPHGQTYTSGSVRSC